MCAHMQLYQQVFSHSAPNYRTDLEDVEYELAS